MKLYFFTSLLMLMISGCATAPSLTRDQQQKALEPLTCTNKQECDLYWQRAQSWVAQNSHWRIQIATDVLLQTYGPGDDAFNAFTITRELDANGGARIIIRAECGNMFGCVPTPIESILAFKLSVKK